MAEPNTDIVINYKGRQYTVPEGFTAQEYVESLASVHPEVVNSKLIKDGDKDGQMQYTLKALYAEKG